MVKILLYWWDAQWSGVTALDRSVLPQINTQKLQKLGPVKDFTLYREFVSFKNSFLFIYSSWQGLFFLSSPEGVLPVQPSFSVFLAWALCLNCFGWLSLLHTFMLQLKNLAKPHVTFGHAIMLTKQWSDAFSVKEESSWVHFCCASNGCLHIRATLFPICCSLGLTVVKNGRCGEKEPRIKITYLFTCHLLEKRVDEQNPFSSKVPVVIWGNVINVLITVGNPYPIGDLLRFECFYLIKKSYFLPFVIYKVISFTKLLPSEYRVHELGFVQRIWVHQRSTLLQSGCVFFLLHIL